MELTKDQISVLASVLQNKIAEQQNRGVQPMPFLTSLLLMPDAERAPLLQGWLDSVKQEAVAAIGALDASRIASEKRLQARADVSDFLKEHVAAVLIPDAVVPETPDSVK